MNAEKKELRKSKIKEFCTKHEKLIINVVGFTATVAALIVVDNIVNPKKTYSITEAQYYVHETKTKPIIYLECAVNDLKLKDTGKLGKTLSENYALNGSDEISAILAIHAPGKMSVGGISTIKGLNPISNTDYAVSKNVAKKLTK